jgi:multidrug efflux pump subunit AcrA (membrane-fusion protein)
MIFFRKVASTFRDHALVPVTAAAAGAALLIVGAPMRTTVASAENSAPHAAPTQAAQVVVARAHNACFSATIRVTGFLVARQEAVVTLDAPGLRVTEVLAGEGDKVTAGQPLARAARQDGTDAAGARNAVVLRAPAAGTVVRSTAVTGATPRPGAEPLFRIAVDGELELEAEVPSIHVPELASGQSARIELDGNRELSGRVRLVPAAIERRTQLGHARLSLEREPELRLGMFARAAIDARRSCGVSVPGSAVLYRTGGASVQVVREEVIETRLVQVGLRSDTDTEIREGVREDELVVANAGSSLRDGDRVTAIFADGGATGR